MKHQENDLGPICPFFSTFEAGALVVLATLLVSLTCASAGKNLENMSSRRAEHA